MRARRTSGFCLSLGFAALSACGTYSAIRPADNLRQGQVEVATGLAVNQIGEVLPVTRLTIGVTDQVEIGGQYEIYSALAGVRFALARSERNGFAFAAGVEGGYISLLETLDDELEVDLRAEAFGGVAAIGRRWDSFEFYALTKALAVGWAQNTVTFLGVYRGGARFTVGDTFLVGFEGGGTLHEVLFIGEGTAYIGLTF